MMPLSFAGRRLWTVRVAALSIVLLTAIHATMVLVYNLPTMAISDDLENTVDKYSGPWLRQNWRLFAPDPAHGNLHVLARGRTYEGFVTDWTDVTSFFIQKMRENTLTPTHALFNGLAHSASSIAARHSTSNPMSRAVVVGTSMMVLQHEHPGRTFQLIDVRIDSHSIAPLDDPNEQTKSRTLMRLGWFRAPRVAAL